MSGPPLKPPAASPCGSCPYRRDVPSGVWAEEEYVKLLRYDGLTWEQDPTVFACHRQDGRLCAGWVAVHDMDENLGLRLATAHGLVRAEDVAEIRSYTTTTPLFASGGEAAEHGLRDQALPLAAARRMIDSLARRAETFRRRH
jgi:Family of unknown function (DUF6283)